MRSFKDIKERYHFTEDDKIKLQSLGLVMANHADEVLESLNSWMIADKEASKLIVEESKRDHIFRMQKEWFLGLFSGNYDSRYFEKLIKIGTVHLKANVEAHLIHRAINLIRNSCMNIILNKLEIDSDQKSKMIISFQKILDISHDVITSAYIEEEIRTYSPIFKIRNTLLEITEKFSQLMNLVLIFSLVGLSVGVVLVFVHDILTLFRGELYSGIVSSLGSILLLWVMIELMNTEISHLKGGKLHISVFVGVALVTMIRETMIATLKHESPEITYYLIAAILVIGFIYWLVTKSEDKRR